MVKYCTNCKRLVTWEAKKCDRCGGKKFIAADLEGTERHKEFVCAGG